MTRPDKAKCTRGRMLIFLKRKQRKGWRYSYADDEWIAYCEYFMPYARHMNHVKGWDMVKQSKCKGRDCLFWRREKPVATPTGPLFEEAKS